jgi:hypothetical protein
MNRQTYTYAYGFIAGILLAAFVVVMSYAMCDWHCDRKADELFSKGTVIIVPRAVVETQP